MNQPVRRHAGRRQCGGHAVDVDAIASTHLEPRGRRLQRPESWIARVRPTLGRSATALGAAVLPRHAHLGSVRAPPRRPPRPAAGRRHQDVRAGRQLRATEGAQSQSARPQRAPPRPTPALRRNQSNSLPSVRPCNHQETPAPTVTPSRRQKRSAAPPPRTARSPRPPRWRPTRRSPPCRAPNRTAPPAYLFRSAERHCELSFQLFACTSRYTSAVMVVTPAATLKPPSVQVSRGAPRGNRPSDRRPGP